MAKSNSKAGINYYSSEDENILSMYLKEINRIPLFNQGGRR